MAFKGDSAGVIWVASRNVCVACQEGVERKGTALTVVVCSQDDEGVLDGDDEGQGPDDDGERTDEIVPAGLGCERRGVDVEGRGANVAVDCAGALEAEPEEQETAVCLFVWKSAPRASDRSKCRPS